MAICHTVRRGDSLWGLANRYLGDGAKWPAILERHNLEAARPGRDRRLLPIKDPNLIYVSQYIMIPGDRRKVPAGTGTKPEAGRSAVPVNLKVFYTIGRDTPPMVYVHKEADLTISSEMSGEIGIELKSADRYHHNLELMLSKAPSEAKFKLAEAYDPALCALTARPGFGFDSGTGKVTITAPIAAKAGLGPYTVSVQAESPLHLSGTLKPNPVEGTVEVGGRAYKFSAETEFKVDVYLEPKPRGREPVRITDYERYKDIADNPVSITGFEKIITTVAWTIIGIGLALMGCKVLPTVEGTTTIQPFMHTIDPSNHRNRKFLNNNA
jgi:hypothetical protein